MTRIISIPKQQELATDAKIEGSVEVTQKVRKASYNAQLLSWIKTILVVHASNLKPYNPNQEDTKHDEETRPLATMKNITKEKEEKIMLNRCESKNQEEMYKSFL